VGNQPGAGVFVGTLPFFPSSDVSGVFGLTIRIAIPTASNVKTTETDIHIAIVVTFEDDCEELFVSGMGFGFVVFIDPVVFILCKLYVDEL